MLMWALVFERGKPPFVCQHANIADSFGGFPRLQAHPGLNERPASKSTAALSQRDAMFLSMGFAGDLVREAHTLEGMSDDEVRAWKAPLDRSDALSCFWLFPT